MADKHIASPTHDIDWLLDRESRDLLYKFRSTRDDNHWSCLKKGTLWISGAMDLNDPFDSKPKSLLFRGTAAIRQAFRDSVQSVGVLSFSGAFWGDDKDILQWAHYADGHRGYCLMIRDRDLWNKTKPVTYLDTHPEIAEHEPASPEFWDKVGFFKAPCWQYENERRALLPGEGRTEYQLPKGAIFAVVFGCWSRREERETVARYAKRHSPNCYFFHAEIVSGKFALCYHGTTPEYHHLQPVADNE